MNSEIQVRLLEAIGACLRPLVRMLLRSGISYRQFDEIVKLAFVRESLRDPDQPKRRTNISRIAVRTGMSRKEVARIRKVLDATRAGEYEHPRDTFHSSQAARLLQVWHSDARFLDKSGRPVDLAFDAGDLSFAAIVKLVGGDVPAGAVRAELLAAGAAEETEVGRLRVLKRHFIPGDLGEEMVVGFKHIVTPLLGGLAHNSQVPKSEAFIQRVSYSDSLPPSATASFRRMATEQAAALVQSADDWLGSNEEAQGDSVEPRPRVGIGVFYFEEDAADVQARK